MPFEITKDEDVTPLKASWNRSNLSITSPASLDGSYTTNDNSFHFPDAGKLLEIPELELRSVLSPDVSFASLNDSNLSSLNKSVLSTCKPRLSDDSGISSIAADNVSAPSSTPPKQLSPEFKHKISIYSKVSGCRMTNLTDYWIVKQIRVAVLQHLTNGNPTAALAYKFGYEKMANGGLQIISESEELITMLGALGYFAGIPCKMTFPDTPRVVGFVKALPTDLEPSDLKDEIRKSYPEVYSVRYVTEKSRGFAHGIQRPCAFISFNLRYLPKTVVIFEETFDLQVPNPMQCTRCCRYGHQGKQCRAQTRCSFCGGTHHRQVCGAKVPVCINCQGMHSATSHDCVIWQQGKYMNELRYRGGLTAEEAIAIASSGKVSQKKHSFTQADFFENQDSLFFGCDRELPVEDEEQPANEDEVEEELQPSPKITHGKNPSVHARTAKIFPFLDLMTDLFLKIKNPGENLTSSVLMPGYDEQGFPTRRNKKNSTVAKNFKDSVMAAAKSSTQSPSYQ